MIRSALLAAVLACLVGGCQGADAYYRHLQLMGGTGGAAGMGGGGGTGGPGSMPPDGSASDGLVTLLPMDASGDGSVVDGDQASDRFHPDLLDGAGNEAGAEAAVDVPVCTTCKGDVLYWCEGTAANTIRATFQLINDTPAPIPLRELTIRYWFTAGVGASPWDFACDNGALGTPPATIDVTAYVTHVFRPVAPARPGADIYFEVGFSPAAGELLPQQPSLFRTRVYRNDYSTITQTDDYSFNPKFVAPPAAWSHITLYRNGILISGVEPR